jgi:glycosyltransferase involved in cell wall biosynthesis
MKILYLSYWSINDGLTKSAIFPHLEMLSDFEQVEEIFLFTIERKVTESLIVKLNNKVKHVPLFSKQIKWNQVNKINDFIIFPKTIKSFVSKNTISFAITHGSPGGALLQKSLKGNVPFYVFFEPHSQYMLESKVWNKNDLRYLFMKKWENKVKRYATQLFCVTNNYRQALISEGISENRLKYVPNYVDEEKFKFNSTDRSEVRKQLNIESNKIVGIYVGKFGGIYLDIEAFEIFSKAFEVFENNFYLILLSPDNSLEINEKLKLKGIDTQKVLVKSVEHNEVPKYLSASDFAFSLQQPKNSNKYLSPLKNGEYWMNGLQVLMIEGVGDENNFIINEKGGAVINIHLSDINEALQKIKSTIHSSDYDILRKITSNIALTYRAKKYTMEAFNEILNHVKND